MLRRWEIAELGALTVGTGALNIGCRPESGGYLVLDVMPTDRELRINEKIMGACNHPDYEIVQEVFERHPFDVAVCVSCGAREMLSSSNEKHPLDLLKDKIQPHCLDMTMIRRVTRKLESEGWRLTMNRVDRTYQYFLSKDGHRLNGDPVRDELEAMCNVVDKLARAR